MKQKILSAIMMICMMLMIFPMVAEASENNPFPPAVDGVITLEEDVTLTETYVIDSTSLTIDGNGHTITGTIKNAIKVENGTDAPIVVTFKNVKIKNTAKYGRCINTRNDNIVLNLNGATLIAKGVNSQPLTIGGDETGEVTVNVDETSVIDAGDSGYGITSFVPNTLTIDGSVSGYAALYMKEKSAGSVVVVNGALDSTNTHNGPSNNFGTIVLEDNGIDITVNGTVTATKDSDAIQTNLCLAKVPELASGDNKVNITIAGDAKLTGDIVEGIDTNTITLTTTNTAVAEALKAEGYNVVNGQVAAVAKVNDVEYMSLADAVAANKDTTDPVTIYIMGNATWETGAAHGSTPFGMATSALTIEGVDGTNATFTATGKGVGPVGQESGTVTFKNLTIKDESVSYAENNWEFGYLEFRGALEFVNCTFVNAVMFEGDNLNATFTNCDFNSNNSNEYDAWVCDGSATFTNCTFEGYRGLKVHEAYGSEVISVTVDNCTFGPLSKKPGIAIGTLNADTAITVKNSTFIDCQPGDQGKYIYETDTDVTTFTFTLENNDVTCSVHKLTKTDAVAPKCEETGNIAYWTCDVCTKIFNDEAATTQITAEDTVTSATGHTEKTVGKYDATCVENGYTGDVVCSVCSNVIPGGQGETIPATGVHTYLDGKCTMCQVADPDYKPEEKVEVGVTDSSIDTMNSLEETITNTIIQNGTLPEGIKLNDEGQEKIDEVIPLIQNGQAEAELEKVANPIESVPEEEETKIKESLETISDAQEEKTDGEGVLQYLDVYVLFKVKNTDVTDEKAYGKTTTVGKVEEMGNEYFEFTVTIPEKEQKPGRKFFILREHNGKVDELPLTPIGENKYTFETNLYSTYAIAYVDVHVHTETLINAEGANCGTDGYTGDIVCAVCGDSIAEGSVIKADGNHHWSEWKNQEGIAYTFRECWDCGASEYLNAPADAPVANKPATSTGAPATGDTSNMFVWITLMVVCCGVVLGTMVYRKNK